MVALRWITAALGGSWLVACTAANARPPTGVPLAASDAQAEATRTPPVGRVRMRDRVVDLTPASLAEGGDARELSQGMASPVMADIDADHVAPVDRSRDERAR